MRKILLGTPPERAADPNALADPDVLRYFVPQLPNRNDSVTMRWQGHRWPGPMTGEHNHKGVDRMPDSDTDKAKEALLAKAAEAWREDPVLAEDDVCCFLDAYYQRLATEDLAPPSRLAAVAEAHARLGRSRPQGRALVQVREPGPRLPGPAHPVRPGRQHRHRRHAVPGQLGHHRTEPARRPRSR